MGLAPLRSALFYLAAHREQYKRITLLYGGRTPEDILFKNELQQWQKQGLEIEITVDQADSGWQGHVGVVTALITKHLASPRKYPCLTLRS